jgi:hypothetical protein
MGMRMGAGALVPLLAQVTSPLYRAIEIDTQSPPELRGRDLAQVLLLLLPASPSFARALARSRARALSLHLFCDVHFPTPRPSSLPPTLDNLSPGLPSAGSR